MEAVDWLRALLALAVTVALIVALAAGARRFNLLKLGPEAAAGRRLQIVESLAIDPRRRLIVVRLDSSDHLILLSPTGDAAIATTSAPAAAEAAP